MEYILMPVAYPEFFGGIPDSAGVSETPGI